MLLFYSKVCSQLVFCQLLLVKVLMQLLSKGALMIRDAKLLDIAYYSNFLDCFSNPKKEDMVFMVYALLSFSCFSIC
jgi:hypothetical protein